MNRRLFLNRSAATCACAVAGVGCGTQNLQAKTVTSAADPKGRIAIGAAQDLAVGAQLKVVIQGEEAPVLVARPSDSEVRAISIACSHYGSELAFIEGEGLFECTDHGSRFDYNGKVLQGPAEDTLATYTVEEADGQLFLLTP